MHLFVFFCVLLVLILKFSSLVCFLRVLLFCQVISLAVDTVGMLLVPLGTPVFLSFFLTVVIEYSAF